MLEKSTRNEVHYGISFSRDARSAPNIKTFSLEEVRDRIFDEVVSTGIIEFGHEKVQVVAARKVISTSDLYLNYELLKQRRKEEVKGR